MAYPKLTVANAVLKNSVHFVTADYKTRNPNYRNHNGIDLIGRNDKGEDYARDYIVAIADGVVDAVTSTYTKTLPNATGGVIDRGNWVRIKHSNGLYSCYFHLAVNTINVKAGQAVHKGDILGYMGNTGYSKGNHLHFAVGNGKEWLDPLPYLTDPKAWGDTTASKSVDELADEVLAGKWGNGADRKNRLTAAGYDYSAVQAAVNAKTPPAEKPKTSGGFKVGDKVHIISGSTDVNTHKKYASWVYVKTYDVIAVDDKYLTFGTGKNITGKTYIENCRLR